MHSTLCQSARSIIPKPTVASQKKKYITPSNNLLKLAPSKILPIEHILCDSLSNNIPNEVLNEWPFDENDSLYWYNLRSIFANAHLNILYISQQGIEFTLTINSDVSLIKPHHKKDTNKIRKRFCFVALYQMHGFVLDHKLHEYISLAITNHVPWNVANAVEYHPSVLNLVGQIMCAQHQKKLITPAIFPPELWHIIFCYSLECIYESLPMTSGEISLGSDDRSCQWMVLDPVLKKKNHEYAVGNSNDNRIQQLGILSLNIGRRAWKIFQNYRNKKIDLKQYVFQYSCYLKFSFEYELNLYNIQLELEKKRNKINKKRNKKNRKCTFDENMIENEIQLCSYSKYQQIEQMYDDNFRKYLKYKLDKINNGRPKVKINKIHFKIWDKIKWRLQKININNHIIRNGSGSGSTRANSSYSLPLSTSSRVSSSRVSSSANWNNSNTVSSLNSKSIPSFLTSSSSPRSINSILVFNNPSSVASLSQSTTNMSPTANAGLFTPVFASTSVPKRSLEWDGHKSGKRKKRKKRYKKRKPKYKKRKKKKHLKTQSTSVSPAPVSTYMEDRVCSGNDIFNGSSSDSSGVMSSSSSNDDVRGLMTSGSLNEQKDNSSNAVVNHSHVLSFDSGLQFTAEYGKSLKRLGLIMDDTVKNNGYGSDIFERDVDAAAVQDGLCLDDSHTYDDDVQNVNAVVSEKRKSILEMKVEELYARFINDKKSLTDEQQKSSDSFLVYCKKYLPKRSKITRSLCKKVIDDSGMNYNTNVAMNTSKKSKRKAYKHTKYLSS